ncbi:factor-induced gene 2 protein [Oncorhynchus kisutch]|uniref:factor-induced gene 2 protein n=1 Tax=Oncorhynchus kisutch TaxID=8019 RepID=UPI0012DF78DF|nr:factor-induced gene 2 protein-like [Oncorhynchus kisutch]
MFAEGPGLVDSVSSTLVTCSSLIGQAGSLQSITQQLSEIEQRLLKEHFKGTITTEDLHTIIHSVVVTVVEEVNGILIPAIMAFEYERLTGSVSSSDIPSSDVPTYSSPSSSDYYRTSSFSTSLQSSSPQIGLSSPTPTPPIMPFKPTTGVIRQRTLTVSFPEEADRESERETEGEASLSVDLAASSSPSPSENQSSPLETSPLCLRSSGTSFESAGTHLESSGSSLGSLGTDLLVKVEAVIQEVIRGAVDKLEAERNNRHGRRVRNMSPEEKAESVSKSTEAASRESSGERRVRGVGSNGKKVETVADRVAKTEVSTIADTTAKTELLTIEDTMAKLEIKKVEIIADVIPKTASKEVATTMEKVEAKEEDNLADVMARTEFTEVPIIAGTTAKNEVQEVETIADVTENTKIKEVVEINKRDTQEAKVKASFETEVELTKRLDIDTKTEEEANAEMNPDEQDNTISENNNRCFELILTAREAKIEVRDEKIECKVELRDENIGAKNETMDATDSVENAHAGKSEHSHVSPELFQSSSDNDEGGPSMFPMTSMLKSAALSSDQVDEILDKVIDVLTGEGHKFIFSEYRPSMTSSSDSTVCIASSPESRPGLTSTPVDRTSSSSIPEARPSSSSIPEGRPSSSSIPEGRPSSSSIPEARPSSSSIPEARPSSSSIPEARPSSSSIPEGRPSSSSIPEARPSSSSIPEVRPSCSSIPEARPSSFSIPEGRPSSSSIPEARPSSTSIPEARPSSSSATPGSSPSSESLCCMSSGHNQEINVQCPSDPPGKLLGGQASTPRPQNPLLLSEEDLSDRELMPYANSIINIIMQKMHHDDDLYESVGGQKPLSPRRRSRSALLSQYSHQDNSEISVLYIPKRADRKSLKSVDPKALRVVRWVLQTIHRRHGWLGQANDHSRQAKESLLLCDVIQVLLEKLDHKMATTGDLQVAPTQTYALHTDDRFKTKLQEATVEPISDIIGHLSINLLRSESCFVPKKRWSSSSTRAKSVSMTNLGSRAAASAVAMDISSKVVEKLKEASGSSKTTCSMTSLRDFVRAMTVSQPELSQQATSCGSKIHNVYREVLEIVVTKLRSFVTKGGSFHKPTEHLAQKMAESCLEVECAFMEILQTLKSHGTGDEACSAWAVDCMSTTISDTMFKRVTEGGHPPHLTHVSGATVTNCGPIRVSDVNQKRPIKIKARMSRSSVNLLQTTVEKFVHKLTGERVSIPELGEGMSTSTSPQQGKDPENLQRFTTEPPSELSPRSQLKREELISMLCALMSKSIISSLSLDRAFLVPVDAVSDTKESRASAVKLGRNTSTLVPTPPPRPTHTNSQTDNKPVQEDSRRRFRPLRTLQAAKRVVSSMDLGISRTTSRSSGVVGQLACPAKSNNNLFSEPPSTSAASSNTSLVASEITENVVCQLLQGDSPDFMSSSNHTSPRGTTFN